MKKILSIFMLLLALTLLVSCTPEEEPPIGGGKSQDTVRETADLPMFTELYPVSYIRAGGYVEGGYPYTVKIASREELDSYISGYGEYGIGKGFINAVEKYDAAFFEENMLVFAIVEEGSGSIRHELMGVTADDIILIKRIVPEEGTCDMAEWHIIIEMPRARALDRSFTVEYYGEDNRELVYFGYNYTNVTGRLPKGWAVDAFPFDYEVNYEGYDSLYEYAKAKGVHFGIEVYPKASSDLRVKLYYWASYPGACGTGIRVEDGTLGGHRVMKHINEETGELVRCFFIDVTGDYVLEITGSNTKPFEAEILEFVESLEFGSKGVNRERAMMEAEKYVTVEYDFVRAEFDFTRGEWLVNVSKVGTVGGDQTVVLYMNGKHVQNIYGE